MLGTAVAFVLSFVVFMLAMKAVYFDPVLKIKHEREAKLVGDKESAQQFNEEYARLRTEYELGLSKARKEAHAAIQQIRQEAKVSAQQVLTEARSQGQQEMEQRMAELAEWRESTYRELEGERANLTRQIVEKVRAGGRVTTARGA